MALRQPPFGGLLDVFGTIGAPVARRRQEVVPRDHLRARKDHEPFPVPGLPVRPRSRRHRALRRRVEPPHRLDDVAVQQEPRRERMGRAVHVDDPPAHREIPGVGRRGKAGVAEGDEARRERVDVERVPRGYRRRPRRRRPRGGASSPPRRRSGRRPRRGGRKGAGAARASGRGPRGGAGGPARTASPRWKGTGGPRRGQDRRSVPGSPPPPPSRRRTGKGACGRGARRDGPRGTTAPRAGSASTGRRGRSRASRGRGRRARRRAWGGGTFRSRRA